jgi:energy-coupling factor transport system ATP-binding protein
VIELQHFSFTYGGAKSPVLEDINLKVDEGELILIVGRSGSGKSTLCRALNGLVPHFYGGEVSGRVIVDGLDTRDSPPAKLAGLIGMVFQDPENQLVMTNVENEMAFGLENMALPKAEMKERVSYYSGYFDLQRFFKRFIPELSGGEKQKVALASVLAMKPKYIILDEPTSQLDEETAALFLGFVKKLNDEHGIAVILIEHRLERCIHYAKRIIYMENGRIAADGLPEEIIPHLRDNGLMADFFRAPPENGHAESVVSAQGISFAYGSVPILADLSMDVKGKEIVAIIGLNGCGKSTLLKHLNGILRPKTGTVTVLGRDIRQVTTASLAHDIGYLGQNPNNYLFEENLQKEMEFSLSNLKVDRSEWPQRIDWVLKVLDLEEHRHHFPRDLSCGQRERAALATVLIGKPKILILDEPTRGLDYTNKMKLAGVLSTLREQGMTTILVTHDYRFVAEHASRVLTLNGGRLKDTSIDSVVDLAKEVCGMVA